MRVVGQRIESRVMRSLVIDENLRADGRCSISPDVHTIFDNSELRARSAWGKLWLGPAQPISTSCLTLALHVLGRSMTEVRPISSRAGGFLPRTHGCALFTRGETQALAVTTLGAPHKFRHTLRVSHTTVDCVLLSVSGQHVALCLISNPHRMSVRQNIGRLSR